MNTTEEQLEAIKKEAEDYAEKTCFRVPYDGSNKFYDEKQVKTDIAAYIKAATIYQSRLNEQQLVIERLREALEGFTDYPQEDIDGWIELERPVTITVLASSFKKAKEVLSTIKK